MDQNEQIEKENALVQLRLKMNDIRKKRRAEFVEPERKALNNTVQKIAKTYGVSIDTQGVSL